MPAVAHDRSWLLVPALLATLLAAGLAALGALGRALGSALGGSTLVGALGSLVPLVSLALGHDVCGFCLLNRRK